MNIKSCIFCDAKIAPYHIACRDHYAQYIQYKDHEWCKYLVKNTERQFQIDKRECGTLDNLVNVDSQSVMQVRTKSAPKQEILRLYYEKKMRINDIARELKLPYHTVYAVIRRNPIKK